MYKTQRTDSPSKFPNFSSVNRGHFSPSSSQSNLSSLGNGSPNPRFSQQLVDTIRSSTPAFNWSRLPSFDNFAAFTSSWQSPPNTKPTFSCDLIKKDVIRKLNRLASSPIHISQECSLEDLLLKAEDCIETFSSGTPIKSLSSTPSLLSETSRALNKIKELKAALNPGENLPEAYLVAEKSYQEMHRLIKGHRLAFNAFEASKQISNILESLEDLTAQEAHLLLADFMLWTLPFLSSPETQNALSSRYSALKESQDIDPIRSYIYNSSKHILRKSLEDLAFIYDSDLISFDMIRKQMEPFPAADTPPYALKFYRFLESFFEDYARKIQEDIDQKSSLLEAHRTFLKVFD